MKNPGFEEDTKKWKYFNDDGGTFAVDGSDSHECLQTTKVSLGEVTGNTQFYQKNVSLKANTQYRLR